MDNDTQIENLLHPQWMQPYIGQRRDKATLP